MLDFVRVEGSKTGKIGIWCRTRVTKLLANASVKSFIERQEPEILEHFELVVNTVSMEEAVQQQQEVESTTISDTDTIPP